MSRFKILEVPSPACPAVGGALDPNQHNALGDNFDELDLAVDQAKYLRGDCRQGHEVVVCDVQSRVRVL